MKYSLAFGDSNSSNPRYSALSGNEEEADKEVQDIEIENSRNVWKRRRSLWALFIAVVLVVGGATVLLPNSQKFRNLSTQSEWHLNDTLYDDFPRLHQLVGTFAHEAATFLSWHRGFIQIYETTLREKCGYQGHLTYWDWSLDYENPASTVVFNSYDGFGGDGDLQAPKSVGKGRCVTDGPFAGLQAKYFDDVVNNPEDKILQHCLSRGFKDGKNGFSGHKFRPEAMERLWRQKTYDKFFLYLELGPHNGIPQGIQGDFMTFTAPYDPLFFLHHTQIDRLWWLWQQAEPSSRLNAYSGRKNGTRSGFNETATLDDLLPYHGLGSDVIVCEVMNTRSKLLCYQY
ncbi:Di-copper centre-containing protein [Hyaloscypha variabilis F]|uniref:Di-copper centre-containing protein n=1 Tax=Hyaloscypha variabilis (strain UAMH 11265 / GT02V1 / F) TaxID=1149755 RepID=A0A2J6S1F6_HYAVF|nr:Di-copper centre-containing protein [Hyaloscypha variabilis F]